MKMEPENDWQDAAFNTRHLHNRNDRGGRGQKRHEFQVGSMFGTHLIKCPAIDRLQADSAHAAARSDTCWRETVVDPVPAPSPPTSQRHNVGTPLALTQCGFPVEIRVIVESSPVGKRKL
ncbi:hypothetical protein F5883DRAFT_591307 [Diaporthe sp. PMI_573]|nr:hypothetical protein F5883DRAFT_591307 [Diaporthaceae sp. PMI_573]